MIKWIKSVLETYRKGKKFDELEDKKDDLKTDVDRLENREEELEGKLQKALNEAKKAEEAIQEARKKIRELRDEDKAPDPDTLKAYYMMKYEQNDWEYPIRGDGTDIPVSYAFNHSNKEIVTDYAKQTKDRHDLSNENTPTELMTALYEDTVKEWDWDYELDKEHFGKIEYWQAPDKSLKDMTGDCDDKTLAMIVVARRLLELCGHGESKWRIRLAAGRTLSGGHAYSVWLAEDCEWYVMESTMDARGSLTRVWLETPIRNQNFYKEFYGFATPEQTWRGDLDVVEPYEDGVKQP